MYYIKLIMKINFLKLTKYIYYFALILIIILYLFPGSLIGYLLYGDLTKQPDLIPNLIGTSINHSLAFFCLSILGLIIHLKNESFYTNIIFLISLSIILELFHYFIPNRSFEFLDLFGNLIGTLAGAFVIILNEKFKKKN